MDHRNSSLPTSRRIPRPWLANNHQYVPSLPNQHQYRYGNPALSNSNAIMPGDSIDLLEKPDWKLSWGKLSCCFCLPNNQSAAKNTSSQNNDGRLSSYFPPNVGRRFQPELHDYAPFPAFPIIRRNSSTSLLAYSNDIYTRTSDGSFSSFTESDTSYSDSEDGRNRKDRFDGNANAQNTRPLTPPPAPVSVKPPTISNRSRSAGLPPINPSSSFSTPQPPNPRHRIDTGDYTGIHSGTTNTSRHRRNQHFEFSPNRMEQIWQRGGADDKSTFPSYVLCDEGIQTRSFDNGYVSALDESDDLGSTQLCGSFYDSNEDNDTRDDYNDRKTPQPSQTERRLAVDEWKQRKGEKPPKGTRKKSQGQRLTTNYRKSSKKPPIKSDPVLVPVYLRKYLALDDATEGNLVVAGWVAVSLGNDSLESRLLQGSRRIEVSDIYYLRIVDSSAQNGGASMLLHSPSGAIEHAFTLRKEWTCQSREISSRIGRSVTIRSRRSPAVVIATILPVSLDDSFFRGESLVTAQNFSRLHDRLFVGGKGKVYAPDEQHDAAMYIMFSLDTLIHNSFR